jgi:Domain of unknown function (DU1801)
MQSKAMTVAEYIAELPNDRREAILRVRDIVLANIDQGFEEGMQYGYIGYYVPHSIFPAGYHCDPKQPLPFICLASQKNHMALYVMSLYGDDQAEKEFRRDWATTGKKLDMGKSCIRFKKLDDLPLDVIGRAIKRIRLSEYVRRYEHTLEDNRMRREQAKTTKKAAGRTASNSKLASLKKSGTGREKPKSARDKQPVSTKSGKVGRVTSTKKSPKVKSANKKATQKRPSKK